MHFARRDSLPPCLTSPENRVYPLPEATPFAASGRPQPRQLIGGRHQAGISSIPVKSWFVIFGALALAACGGGSTGVDPQEALGSVHSAVGRQARSALARPRAQRGFVVDAVAADTYNAPARDRSAGTPVELRPIWPMDLATVHLAMYDAAMAIARTHKPYAIEPAAPTGGASIDAAVGAAAHGVLKALFPTRAVGVQTAYDAGRRLPDGVCPRTRSGRRRRSGGRHRGAARQRRPSVALPPFVPGTCRAISAAWTR